MVNFKQLLEKATSADLLDPDWESILQIVEEVKTKSVSAKNAIRDLKRRLQESSGNALYYTVVVLESLMKNCASDLHSEVLTVDFLSVLKDVITSSKDGRSEKAVDKALELIGEWKAAFGEQTGYKAINTVFSDLERSGYHIPVATVASAAFIKKAPEWVLSDKCFMCRQEFNRFKGKLRHHCRNCGKSVCAACSTKRVPLPHFGVQEATRVCDICHKKVEKGEGETAAAAIAEMSSDLPVEYLRSSLAQESQAPPNKSTGTSGGGGTAGSEQQMQEEDDLQLAIAMSLNEQENKSAKKSAGSSSRALPPPPQAPTPPPQSTTPSAPPPQPQSTLYASIMHNPMPEQPPPTTTYNGVQEEMPSADPLARYLDRNYWEQRKEQQSGGRGGGRGLADPQSTQTAGTETARRTQQQQRQQSPAADMLAESIQNSINMFVKRLHEVGNKGGSIATDPVVLSLYQNLTAMQPQLLKQIDDIQLQKAKQVAVLNKLNEAKEARVTLNKMRRDHQDKVKQMEQEQAMLARMQMEQKLALLRQQKQEQMEFQQNLQQKRLEVLQTQRMEYEQKVAAQRELERKQLIEQEQKVIQHQFGPSVMSVSASGQHPSPLPGASPHQSPQMKRPIPQQMSSSFQSFPGQATSMLPPAPTLRPPNAMDPSSLSMQSLSLQPQQQQQQQQQAPPLPSKTDFSMSGSVDVGVPPPYNPVSLPYSLQDPLATSSNPQYSIQSSSTMPQWNGSQSQLPPPNNTGFQQQQHHQPPPPQQQQPPLGTATAMNNGGYGSMLPPNSSHDSVQPQYSSMPPPSMQLNSSVPQQQHQPNYTSVHPSGLGQQQPPPQQQSMALQGNYSTPDPSHYGQDLHSDSSGGMAGAISMSSSQQSQMGSSVGVPMGPPPGMGQVPMGQVPMGPPQPAGQPVGQQVGQMHPHQQGYGRQESEPPLISFD